jgi:hypothetical protein
VRWLFAAVPLLLAGEVSDRSGTFNLGIVKGSHSYAAVVAIDSSLQKTDQSRATSYGVESTRNVENRANVEMGCLKPEKKQLCMVTKPDQSEKPNTVGKSRRHTNLLPEPKGAGREIATFSSTEHYILHSDRKCLKLDGES